MIFYLTYNESSSAILSSQVIDVVKFLNKNFSTKVKLFAFISLRDYFSNKEKIKSQLPTATVYPMFPRMKNWSYNRFLLKILCYVYKPHTIISRSVMATKLAIQSRDSGFCKKVIYDGRGAIAAEWKEYDVVVDKFLLGKIEQYEKEVISRSDFRISVSDALVHWWRKAYGYEGTNHVIIPCTLRDGFLKVRLTGEAILARRMKLKLDIDDTVFIYSGSLAGWQSFELTKLFIEPILRKSMKKKMVFFSPPHGSISQLLEMFPEQIIIRQLESNEVQDYLIVGDYGLLIRENSQTNQVASPIKYAEYLSCGLKVIVSDNLGDYSGLSKTKNWGFIYGDFDCTVKKPDIAEKIKISGEAIQFFSKTSYMNSYNKIIQQIEE